MEEKKRTLTQYSIIDRASTIIQGASPRSKERIERAIINRRGKWRGVKFDKFGDETAMLERKRLSRPAREKWYQVGEEKTDVQIIMTTPSSFSFPFPPPTNPPFEIWYFLLSISAILHEWFTKNSFFFPGKISEKLTRDASWPRRQRQASFLLSLKMNSSWVSFFIFLLVD